MSELVRWGVDADLQALRLAAGNDGLLESAIKQRLDDPTLQLLLDTESVAVKVIAKEHERAEPSVAPISGNLLISQSQVWFWAVDQQQEHADFVIDATAIDLHAMTPDEHVYLQVQAEEEEDDPFEIIIEGPNNRIFDALCKLVSLNPVPLEDEDEAFGADSDNEDAFWVAGQDKDGMIVATPPAEEEEQERQQMLERLDNLLIVPPEYELPDDSGQFDDADDDNDIL